VLLPTTEQLGQGVSIRPDILPEAYLEELQKLQDQVPPFSSREAQRLLEAQLGCPIEDVFESRAPFERPVAAASLGQVYKATLREGGVAVAVKVQRPKVRSASDCIADHDGSSVVSVRCGVRGVHCNYAQCEQHLFTSVQRIGCCYSMASKRCVYAMVVCVYCMQVLPREVY
jgi:ABC1 atypical kinase-like domain